MNWLRQLRPLPRSIPPVHYERLTSFIRRLARANHIRPQELAEYLVGEPRTRKGRIRLAELAIVSDRPAESLHHALPELQDVPPGNETEVSARATRACHRCMAAKGVYQQVELWKRSEVNVCVKHREWVGDGDHDGQERPPLDVSVVPDIVNAQKRHTRLVRKFGRAKVAVEFEAANAIVHRRIDPHPYDARTEKRLNLLLGHGVLFFPGDQAVRAAHYPWAVALAGFLLSPYWTAITSVRKNLSFGPDSQLDLISAEIGKRLGRNYRLHGKDRIYERLKERMDEQDGDASIYRACLRRREAWPPPLRVDRV